MELNKEIVSDVGRFNPIITKAGDPLSVGFKTVDENMLQKISDFMPEINRAVSAFSKTNSQTTSSLMTLTMLESGPYRVLRQILAQIEKKRVALKEVSYKLEKKKLDYMILEKEITSSSDINLSWNKKILSLNKMASDIVDATVNVEACIKEIGAYQERYKEVCKNNNIPDNWDEVDFERAEIEHHIKCIFRNAVRDRLQGPCNVGTMEYMEQFGINPITAYALVDNYIRDIKSMIGKEGKGADINAHYIFFDSMYDLFKDEYKKAMNRIGLDSITHAEYLMKENK